MAMRAATLAMKALVLGALLLAYAGAIAHAQQCGTDGCANNLCCSPYDYCGTGCQSGPCYNSDNLGAEQINLPPPAGITPPGAGK